MSSRKKRKKTHTAAFDRCVKTVTRRGGARNPDAICQASLGRRALLKRSRRSNPTRRRSSRPRPRRRNPAPASQSYTIAARREGGRELAFTGTKFSSSGTPVRFPSRSLANTWARHLKRSFPGKLRRYRLRVK